MDESTLDQLSVETKAFLRQLSSGFGDIFAQFAVCLVAVLDRERLVDDDGGREETDRDNYVDRQYEQFR